MRFTVSLDNKQVLNWQSPDYSRLGPSYWNRASKEHLLLGTLDSEWKITKMLVLDLVGKGGIQHVYTGDEAGSVNSLHPPLFTRCRGAGEKYREINERQHEADRPPI